MRKYATESLIDFDPYSILICDGCGKETNCEYLNIFGEKSDYERPCYCKECYPFYIKPEEQKYKCENCKCLTDQECNEKHLDSEWDIITETSPVSNEVKTWDNIGKEKRRITPDPFNKGIGCTVCGNLLTTKTIGDAL